MNSYIEQEFRKLVKVYGIAEVSAAIRKLLPQPAKPTGEKRK
ncbi:hypothetical protein [Paenibacillus oralis]|nr:hypothetical protein [Paenibacillus oralis]